MKMMSSKEIIKNIDDIYSKFQVPPKVIEHCKTVSKVAEQIIKQIKVKNLNEDLIIASCLVHDLANIVKIDFESKLAKELYSTEERKYWNEKKKEIIKNYGASVDEANNNMLRELDADEKIISLLNNSGWENIIEVAKTDSFEEKIYSYSDYRVSPKGIVSLKERLADLSNRYKKFNFSQKLNQEEILKRQKTYFKIEDQLKEKGLKPEKIKGF